MLSQRARAGASRAEIQLVKWTAEGAGKGAGLRVFCDVWGYVSFRRYVGISQSSTHSVNQGGTAKNFVPGRVQLYSAGDFLIAIMKGENHELSRL